MTRFQHKQIRTIVQVRIQIRTAEPHLFRQVMIQVASANFRMASTTARPHLLGGKMNEMTGDQEQHGLVCRGEMLTVTLEAKQTLHPTAITVGTKALQESLSPSVWKGLTRVTQFRTVTGTVSPRHIGDVSMAIHWLHQSTLIQ